KCHGVGFESDLVKLEVKVPKGGGIGQPLRIKEKGHHFWKDLPPGNLYITIGSLTKDHYDFDANLNCVYRLKVDPVEAI
ncbi:DnaJ C-terminal domain-containing protein, partial [Streptomyces scabiei]